ncbi:MAG: LysR substrate-binding domain-containing protein, partial [Rhodospirillaceae bacterium]
MDRLDSMRAFEAVAREGSFTGAARRLGWSTRLVSKYVAALEARLGVQLFHRTTRSVALTDAGRAYVERCRSLLDQVEELEAAVQDHHAALSGSIRMTAPTGFGSTRLPDALADFMATHERVEIDLRLTDRQVSLVEEGFDLAIRISQLQDSALMARKLADMPLVVCAAPRYLEAKGRPDHPQDLAGHACLVDGNQQDGGALWSFWPRQEGKASATNRPEQAETVRVAGRFRANAPAAVVRMAMAGRGITRSPFYAVQDALEAGQLEALLPGYCSKVLGVYAIYPPDRHLSARIRALIDHLVGWYG